MTVDLPDGHSPANTRICRNDSCDVARRRMSEIEYELTRRNATTSLPFKSTCEALK